MTIFLSGSIQPSNDIPVPNYRSVKEALYGLLLHEFHISACISCSDVRTEKIRISKTFLSSSKFLFSRSVNQTNIQLYVHIRLHVQLYNVCTTVSYSCIRIQCVHSRSWRTGLIFIMKICT